MATALFISNKVPPIAVRPLAQRILHAVAAEPERVVSLHAVAELHIAENRLTEAEQVYRKILAGEPKNVTALNNLAWLLTYQRRHLADAIQLAQQAIDLAKPQATLLDTRGLTHSAAGRCEAAITDLREATRNHPAASTCLHTAEANLATGRNRETWDAYQHGKKAGLTVSSCRPLSDRQSVILSHDCSY